MNQSAYRSLKRTVSNWEPSATVSEALGKLFAATPAGQWMLGKYRVELPRVKRADRPAWLRRMASEADLDLFDGAPPEWVQMVRSLGFDPDAVTAQILADYFGGYSKTGNPPEIAPHFGQASTVLHVPCGDGDVMPVAIAWVTPYGSAALGKKYFAEAIAKMQDEKGANVTPKTVDDIAKAALMGSAGMTSSEIGWEFLLEEHPEIAGYDEPMRDELFADEHARMVDRLRQARNRGLDAVTQIVPSVSRLEE